MTTATISKPISTSTPTSTPRPVAALPTLSAHAPAHLAAQLNQQVESQDGAQAVEVAALFDDSVLEVRHFDSPASGRLSRFTKGVFVSASAALLGVGALFGTSYADVAREKAAQEAATRPAATIHAAEPAARTRDAAAAGLLLFGVGSLLYGFHRAGSERRENEFSIGSEAGASYKLDASSLPSARFPLVRGKDGRFELLFTREMTGEATVGAETRSLADLIGGAQPVAELHGAVALPIVSGGRYSVSYGGSTFLVSSVAKPRHYPVPVKVDWQAQSYTAAVLAGATLFLGLAFSTPPDPKSLALDQFMNDRIVNIRLNAIEPKDDDASWLNKHKELLSTERGSKAQKGPQGKMGDKAAPVLNRRAASVGPKNNPNPQLAKKLAEEIAATTGVVGIIKSGQVKGLLAMMSETSALGDAQKEAMGNLVGLEVGDSYGNPSSGIVGVGPGGPGTADNSIGLSNIGPYGRGPGGGRWGNGPVGKLREHVVREPVWSFEPPKIIGSLDRELIRRVVRQHMNEVKFCYESQLARNNSLSGRVVVKFTINNTGSVPTSFVENSTLGNGPAEQCIAQSVRRWSFPQPQGGLVIVSYPFVLKQAGEAP